MPLPKEAQPIVPLDTKSLAYILASLRLLGETHRMGHKAGFDSQDLLRLEKAMGELVALKNALYRRSA